MNHIFVKMKIKKIKTHINTPGIQAIVSKINIQNTQMITISDKTVIFSNSLIQWQC